MKQLCSNPNDKYYYRYGGRGIKVCKAWDESFTTFLNDVGEAPSPKHQLGRIDNDGDYEPGNVEWQTARQLANNRTTSRKITVNGVTKTLQQWSRASGISHQRIAHRIDVLGWSPKRAVSEPPQQYTAPHQITFRGRTLSLAEWSKETGINHATLRQRIIVHGWPVERALTEKPKPRKGKATQPQKLA